MMGTARAHATADSRTRAIKQRIKQTRMHWNHSIHQLSAFLPCIGCTHSMDWMDSIYVSDAFTPWVARTDSLCRMYPLRVLDASTPWIECAHSIGWMHSLHWLTARIPCVVCIQSSWFDCFPSMHWAHPSYVLVSSTPMHLMHSSICCMHSFHCGLTAFVPLVGCISLHWLSAFLFLDCIHSFICWMHPFHGLISSRTLHVFQHCVIVEAFAHYCEGVFMHQMARNTRFKKKSLRCNKIKLCAPLPRGRAVRPGLFNYLK